MTTQLMMWPVLQCEKAPRNCDEREAQGAYDLGTSEGDLFELEPPELEPSRESAEYLERLEARRREVAAAKILK